MTPFNAFFETRRAPLWVIGLVIVLQPVFTAFFNFVVFRNHWTAPLFHATDGFIQGTIDADLPMLVLVVGGLIFWAGSLRPRDVGWKGRNLVSAAALTLALWAIINIAIVVFVLTERHQLILDPSWSKPGPIVNFGSLFAQIFCNALYEETIYRGFLTVQVMLMLKRFGRLPAALIAAVAVQVLFMIIHVPELIVYGHYPLSEVWLTLVSIFIAGLTLVSIYFLTGNIFFAVGVHALVDANMMIISGPLNQMIGFIYIFAALGAAVLWKAMPWFRILGECRRESVRE
jgi:CAAX protease family protein